MNNKIFKVIDSLFFIFIIAASYLVPNKIGELNIFLNFTGKIVFWFMIAVIIIGIIVSFLGFIELDKNYDNPEGQLNALMAIKVPFMLDFKVLSLLATVWFTKLILNFLH